MKNAKGTMGRSLLLYTKKNKSRGFSSTLGFKTCVEVFIYLKKKDRKDGKFVVVSGERPLPLPLPLPQGRAREN
jgi:hypothetical protein